MRVYAQRRAATCCRRAASPPPTSAAIGAHGQTVRHRPQEFDGTGYTMQLDQPALLAELTGIDVVADFRSRDVAAGGQGAPLAPFFHQALFGRAGEAVGVLNIGGISNLTLLRADGAMLGFDCGPGNALMDGWCARHLGRPTTTTAPGPRAAASMPALLHAPAGRALLRASAPPKSTGRDLFNAAWLAAQLQGFARAAPRRRAGDAGRTDRARLRRRRAAPRARPAAG